MPKKSAPEDIPLPVQATRWDHHELCFGPANDRWRRATYRDGREDVFDLARLDGALELRYGSKGLTELKHPTRPDLRLRVTKLLWLVGGEFFTEAIEARPGEPIPAEIAGSVPPQLLATSLVKLFQIDPIDAEPLIRTAWPGAGSTPGLPPELEERLSKAVAESTAHPRACRPPSGGRGREAQVPDGYVRLRGGRTLERAFGLSHASREEVARRAVGEGCIKAYQIVDGGLCVLPPDDPGARSALREQNNEDVAAFRASRRNSARKRKRPDGG
jgi:hypothetical protein